MKNNSYYRPDPEEIADAVTFLRFCTSKDMVESWLRISQEWDVDSVIRIHNAICVSNRMEQLLKNLIEK